jgi:ribosomal protein L17
VTVDAAEPEIKPLLDKLVTACQADLANQCTLLASGVEGGRQSSAHVRVRVKREGVEKLIALAATGGEVASRNTAAEDLEGPIRDNAKRLEMLRSYREKLLALESKAGNNAEALIKLSQELATVQSELESATGVEARLMERVNMDLLNISIQSRSQRGFWSPVKRATSDFASNLSEGIASAITGIAYLLPWALILFVAGAVVRKIWRRIRRK